MSVNSTLFVYSSSESKVRKFVKTKNKRQPYSINQQISFLGNLNRNDKVSIFLGAGISASCGLPLWDPLTNLISLELEASGVETSKTDNIVDLARKTFGANFNSKVAKCLYENGLEVSKSAISIANSGVKTIVCFNYDDILEETFHTEGIPHRVVLNGEKFDINKDETIIFHPHGYLGRFDSDVELDASEIVLSLDDYDKLYLDHYCPTNLIQLSMLMTKTVLFVGMSMTDKNTLRLVKQAREVGVRHWHYALMKIEDAEWVKSETDRLREIGIDPVWYKDHSQIPKIMKRISKNLEEN